MRDEEKLARFNALADKIEKNIDKLIELEAMKCANEERKWRNQAPAYNEQDFINLLGK